MNLRAARCPDFRHDPLEAIVRGGHLVNSSFRACDPIRKPPGVSVEGLARENLPAHGRQKEY